MLTDRISFLLPGGRPRAFANRPARQRLSELIFAIDRWLRRRQGVFEYCQKPTCIFRAQLQRLQTEIVLSDGAHGRAGDRVIDLHLWNEQIPTIPVGGVSLAWGRKFSIRFAESLAELARFLTSSPELKDIMIIRAKMSIANETRSDAFYRFVTRHGFEVIPHQIGWAPAEHIHRCGANIMCWLLALACHARPVGSNNFRRNQGLMYLSRKVLERKYPML